MTRLRSLALLACVILSPLCAEAQHLVDPAEFQKSCEEKFTEFALICLSTTTTENKIYSRIEKGCTHHERDITAGYLSESKTSIEKISGVTTTTQESCSCAPCPKAPR